MASYGCSYSDVLRRSQSPNMLKQGTVVEEPRVGPQSETVGKDVDYAPKIGAGIQVKKEKTEDGDHGGCDASSPSFSYEVQTSLKGNCQRLPEKNSFAEIKEERRDTPSPSDTGETRGPEKDVQEMKEGAERRRTDVSRDGDKIHDASETSSANERRDSKQAHKKRKLYELYAEELSLRNDLRKIHPAIHDRNFEAPIWHQAKEGEREVHQNAEKIAYTQYINKTYADPNPTFKRMGIHEMPSDYRRIDGISYKTGTRTNSQIHKSTAYLPPIDPRNGKFFITEEPRTEQAYRSLQEERLPRAWHPKYGVLFTNPASSEYYSENDLKRSKQSKEDVGSQSKERFERHYRIQADSYWPYFDQSAGRDDVYEKQRISFLRVEHPGEERHNQNKAYQAFPTEQRPESRPSTAEYVKYVPVPNRLIPTPKPDFFLNGLRNMPLDIGHSFPVTDKGSLAFIDKEKVFYPCCNEEIPAIHYDNIASKARWFDSRNERQRFDAFQALKSGHGVPLSGGNLPQRLFLEDAGARIIHMNDLGYKQKNSREKRERSYDVPLPAYVTGMQHEFSKKQFPSEQTITGERNVRRIDEDRRKDGEIPRAWQEKVNGSRTSKETLESNAWDASKGVRNEMLKNGETKESGNKQIDVSQVGEEVKKALQDPKNMSETQPKIAEQNQDDPTSKKTISCSVCNKTFNRTSNLYTHMRTHSANKPHACEFCGKRFHQKADLRIHRYIHTGEKPHKCTKCGRGFKQLTHLKYHMRTHSDVRMYKCPYCEKGFNQKSNLQAHIFGHTGQRPHKCETCGKGFTLASTLNTHKRTHLPNKPFKCEYCDRAFYQKNALKMHYVSTHPYSSGVCLA